jgi:hypothetical protein
MTYLRDVGSTKEIYISGYGLSQDDQIEACSQYRYLQESPKTSAYFWMP